MSSSAGRTTITSVEALDVRFPTSFDADGSDAVHTDPDYSACYVKLKTSRPDGLVGCGLTFTIGRGNELVRHAVDSMRFLVAGKCVEDIQASMSDWTRSLSNESQLRWVGPEKGVTALASAAVINAFWDLWGKREGKPVWKLLADMTPERLVSLVDFRYMDDALTREQALDLLRARAPSTEVKAKREEAVMKEGFPAYTTQVGWLGYSDDKIRSLARKFKDEEGFDAFKLKVGVNLLDDVRRVSLLRSEVGPDCKIMVDANQKWGVNQAIEWMKNLAEFNLTWIEEPTSPDDVLGHKKISEALKGLGMGVATGEHCQNKTVFKQFLQSGALQFCQIDSARLPGGLNEVLAVYLMAAAVGVPVCPHAGGVGLCEMVQHLQVFDFVVLSGTTEDRMIEYVGHLHEHFVHPPRMGRARYFPPLDAGYSTEMKAASLEDYVYPGGNKWKEYFDSGRYRDPSLEMKQL